MQLDLFGGQLPARAVKIAQPTATKSGSSTWTQQDGDVWSRLSSIVGSGLSTREAISQAAVLICLDVLSQDIAKAPMLLHRKDDDGNEVIVRPEDHPLAELFALDPNHRHTWFEFMTMTVLNLGLIDNAYMVVDRRMNGDVNELQPISPGNQRELINTRSRETFYDVTATNNQEMALLGATSRRVAENDMIHVRMRMWDGFWGYPTLKAGKGTIDLSKDLSNYQSRLYSEDAMERGFFSRDAATPLDEPGAKRMREQLNMLMKLVRSRGEAVLLEDGITYESLENNASDNELPKALDSSIASTCRLFRMPQHKAMHLNAVKYENLAIMEQVYVRDTLVPICTAIEQRAARALLSRRDRLRYRISIDRGVLNLQDEERVNKRLEMLLKNGVITRNEARQAVGRNPLPGLDEPIAINAPSGASPEPEKQCSLQVIEGGKGA